MPLSGAPWNTASTHDLIERAMNKQQQQAEMFMYSRLYCDTEPWWRLLTKIDTYDFLVQFLVQSFYFVRVPTCKVHCMNAAGGHSTRHWDPISLFCGSNHSILCGLVLGLFASWSVCHAVQVKLMAVPIGGLLDGGVEEIFTRGSPHHQVKS